MALFDENNDQERMEEKLREYFEEFSIGVRKKLLAKNVDRPDNVYDILYPRTREMLLSKNESKIIDLDSLSKPIRDSLISKTIAKESDLLQQSEDFRKSLLSRNDIHESNKDILEMSKSIRKNLLSSNKNSNKDLDLLKLSETYLINNISKNKPTFIDMFDKINSEKREQQLSKNNNDSIKEKDYYGIISDDYRNAELAKNKNISNSDLLSDSKDFRENNVSKNDNDNNISLLDYSKNIREENLSKQQDSIKTDLIDESDIFRQNNLSKNQENKGDLLHDSKQIRENNISKNKENDGDLLDESEEIRINNLSKNNTKQIDIEKDGENFRKNNISKNVIVDGDLLTDSEGFRENNISNNTETSGDLLTDSEGFRKNNASNNTETSGDLLVDSQKTRESNVSNNTIVEGDLLADSEVFRKNNTSNNTATGGDLLADSQKIRENNVSNNTAIGGDLLTDSEELRKSNVSNNTTTESDLLVDSEGFRENNVSNNTETSGDLLTDSEGFRENNISNNTTTESDLLVDSEGFRENNVSNNTSADGDLLSDSQDFRENNLAHNVTVDGDLLIDSQDFRENNLAHNVTVGGNLLNDSEDFRDFNISQNTVNISDLLTDSQEFRESLLANNDIDNGNLLNDSQEFRENNLAHNVTVGGNLLTDSQEFRESLLANNVENTGDLLSDSQTFRENNLASNSINNGNLLHDSETFRDNNLAKNTGSGLIGINLEGFGTSSFFGISRVLTQGIVFRSMLLIKNKYTITGNQYDASDADLADGNKQGYFSNSIKQEIAGSVSKSLAYKDIADKINSLYGTSVTPVESRVSIGGGIYKIAIGHPQGGGFEALGSAYKLEYQKTLSEGFVNKNIRNYNLERNAYNLKGLQAASTESQGNLQSLNENGFQDLINSTIGSFKGNSIIGSTNFTVTTPAGIIAENVGKYFKGGDPENILKDVNATLNSPESFMAKTVAGNPFDQLEFKTGKRGVKYVTNQIKNNKNIDFSVNYDSQNSKKFIIGVGNDNKPRVSRQRYTVANPYAPSNAGTLLFSLTNFSMSSSKDISDIMYFPPYIQSFGSSSNANWNSIQMLGRPEPIYTYNNSSRDGSITFFVLTDYAETVTIGSDYSSDDMPFMEETFPNHFTEFDIKKINSDIDKLEKKKESLQNQLQQIDLHNNTNSENNVGVDNVNTLNSRDAVESEIAKIDSKIQNLEQSKVEPLYSETSSKTKNVNDLMVVNHKNVEYGDYVASLENTKDRLNQMKSGLIFQPAFFSGDKVDFVNRLEFLEKLTRPSRNNAPETQSGFSFIKPPVCHIRLGDWWDNDIVVNSVSFDYSESPWTLDQGRVQPFWVSVTISFNFIGPYGIAGGIPVLSTDKGGFYKTRE